MSDCSASTIELRAAECSNRLQSLRANLSSRLRRRNLAPGFRYTIYVTGSMAREEGTYNSDLDAFFLIKGSKGRISASRISDIRIFNQVIDVTELAKFPDFSNDGEYLEFIYSDDMVEHLGSRSDDYFNLFTARMLILLEGQFLWNPNLFNQIRNDIISHYFSDFHDHSDGFLPIFLLNDVLRFWRTLCLNYEHKKQWRLSGKEDRAKGHLDNLKLKMSRLLTCYSFVSCLLAKQSPVTPDCIEEICRKTPINRLMFISEKYPEIGADIASALADYSWFLDLTGKPKSDVLDWMSDEKNRAIAFGYSKRFVEHMGNIVKHIAEKNNYLRYLIV